MKPITRRFFTGKTTRKEQRYRSPAENKETEMGDTGVIRTSNAIPNIRLLPLQTKAVNTGGVNAQIAVLNANQNAKCIRRPFHPPADVIKPGEEQVGQGHHSNNQVSSSITEKVVNGRQPAVSQPLARAEIEVLFELWVLPKTTENEIHERLQLLYPSIEASQKIDTIIRYLTCEWESNADAETAISVFAKIHNRLGTFVAGVLLIDFLRFCSDDLDYLMQFHRLFCNDDRFPKPVHDLIDQYLLMRYQQKLVLEYPNNSILTSCPDSIRSKLTFEFCAVIAKNVVSKNSTHDKTMDIISTNEFEACVQISKLLTELAGIHIAKTKCENGDLSWIKFSNYLAQFVTTFCTNLSTKTHTAMQILKLTALHDGIGTTTYMIASANGIRELCLHIHQLERAGCNITALTGNVQAPHAVNEDCMTFVHLLYDIDGGCNHSSGKQSRVTLGVVEIALGFGIPDVWRLIFKGGVYNPTAFLEDNPQDLLPILCLLDRQKEFEKIVLDLPSIFYGPQFYMLVPKMVSGHVISLINHRGLGWSGIQKYKALILWAHAVINKPPPHDPLMCQFDVDVHKQFLHVKHALPLQEMTSWWGKLLPLGYVNEHDIQLTANPSNQNQT